MLSGLIEVKTPHPAYALLNKRQGRSRLIKFGASFPGRRVADALELPPSRGHLPLSSTTLAATRTVLRTYYFDMKDGIPTRDRNGIEFPTAAGAIEHSKELAQRLRNEPRLIDPALLIVVVDESGTEIHREPVHPEAPNIGISLSKIG